jgi:hypothetical protein
VRAGGQGDKSASIRRAAMALLRQGDFAKSMENDNDLSL